MCVVLFLAALVIQAASEPASFREGVAFLRDGRLEEAERAFRAALEESPSHAPSSIQLARAYSREGRNDEARTVLEAGLRLRPKGIVLLNELGTLLLATGDLVGAKATFERALEAQPENPRARMGLGLLLAETRPSEALGHLEAALEAFPNDAPILALAGRLAYSLNRDTETIDYLTRALSQNPKNVEAWIVLGRTYYRRTSLADARNAFEKALESEVANEEAHFYLGEIAAQELRFEDAVEHYGKSPAPAAVRGRARALLKLGRYDEARGALEELSSVEEPPRERAEALLLMANVESAEGHDEKGVAALTAARTLDPNAMETRYLLGTVLARLGRTAEAREELENFQRLKSFEEEKGRLEQAILERPDDAGSYRALVALFLREGRDVEAKVYLEKALLLSPADDELLALRELIEKR
jgi:tetratricopeptide (TPR) repeat protein